MKKISGYSRDLTVGIAGQADCPGHRQYTRCPGFPERDPQAGRYRLGPMLFQLGMTYATNLDLVTITRGWTERLCFQFREPVNCGMLVGNKVVVVLRVEPENRFMVFPQSGTSSRRIRPASEKYCSRSWMEKKGRDPERIYLSTPLRKTPSPNRKRFDEELAG